MIHPGSRPARQPALSWEPVNFGLTLINWPLMAPVQMMCARIGMVAGRDLRARSARNSPTLIVVAALALLLANTINIGADLVEMADRRRHADRLELALISSSSSASPSLSPPSTCRYHQIAATSRNGSALTLFAYVITGFVIGPSIGARSHDTFVPSLPTSHDGWAMLVAILGTTIQSVSFLLAELAGSWRKKRPSAGASWPGGKAPPGARSGTRKMDVGIGTFFSKLRHVFHHFEHGANLARARHDEHRDRKQAAKRCLWPENLPIFCLQIGIIESAFWRSRLSPVPLPMPLPSVPLATGP